MNELRIGLAACLFHLLIVPVAIGAELPLRCDFTHSYDSTTDEFGSFHGRYDFLFMKYGTSIELKRLPNGVCDEVTYFQAYPPKLTVMCTVHISSKRLHHEIEIDIETGKIYDHEQEIGQVNYRINYGTCQ